MPNKDANISKDLESILMDYIDEVGEISDGVLKDASDETAKDLRNTSPQRTGKYASGWTVKVSNGAEGTKVYTVHNATSYRLTHLLENGHVIRNKKGEYGRAPAHPHIKAAEQRAITRLIAELENKL